MTRALFTVSALAGAGLGVASAEVVRGVPDDWPAMFVLLVSGGTGVIALVCAGAYGWQAAQHTAGPARPPAARRRPAVPVAPPLRSPARHGADRTPPGKDIHYFKPGRAYAAFERGNGWNL